MEKFFKPVHNPSDPDKIKPQKHHHHHHHHHHNRRHPQDQQSHRYAVFDEPDRNTDESHGHPHHDQHGHYHNDKLSHSSHHHRPKQHCHLSEEDEILYNSTHAPVTFSKASSSSLSSSSSSSSSSAWYTESSANDPFSLRHAERPQHSLSCSNIPDVRRGFHLDDNTDPIVFATIKHGSSGSICSELIGSSKREKCILSSLDRGHSRSDEGFLQGGDSGPREKPRATNSNYGPLNKSVSLNRSLAFSEENSLLGVSKGPKRAVSSSQLPSKGILKNKEPHLDIRKAKSMEVLSPRVAAGQNPTGQKGKEITSAEIERARENVVQGKLKFSAFLDEITKQVISPSDLNILGVNKNNKNVGMPSAPAQTPEPVKPQLPPKKHREGSGEERAQHLKPDGKQEKVARSSSRKHSDCSNPDKLISYAARNHQGSPPPHHSSPNTHHGSCIKDRRPSPTGESISEDRYGRYGAHLTDGTCTSPELIQPKPRHHRKQQPTLSHSPHSNTQYYAQQVHPGSGPTGTGNALLSSAQAASGGLGSESSSSRSDSSRTRDTLSTETSHSSEQSGRYSHHAGHSEQHTGSSYDTEHLQALQEENADLHQNLLQTVVCIESLEVELQRTRDELSHVKDKYKSLLETHTGTKQANNLLGEHLHIASESLSSERKYMLNRVAQLSTELEDARRTIAALQNINVPCLIKELLEKHFSSAEAIQKFLMTSTPFGHTVASLKTDNQSHCPQVEKASCDWLSKPEAGLQQVTAFTPFKQGVPTTEIESHISDQCDSTHSPPLSVADISTAIYNKMAASYAVRPQPLYPPGQQQPSVVTNLADTPPSNLQQVHVGADSWGRKGGVEALLLEKDIVDVTSMSAQQILNDFMQQLQTHKEAGGQTQQQGGQEWVGGTEQTSRVAD